uniref:helix-turn-helix domain-containing protein n=1 Tax=unclassified Streptomyces TaxID=2593676 RepID=UPI003EC14ED7
MAARPFNLVTGGADEPEQGSATSSTPMRRRLLGAALRRLRDGSGLKGEDVVRLGGIGSKSTLSRLETGDSKVKLNESVLHTLLRCYGAAPDSEDHQAVLAHWRALSSAEQPWWSAFDDVVPATLGELLDMERLAAGITVFEAAYVPGLLQTPPYMSAVMAVPYRGREKDQKAVDRRRKVRRERQLLLDEDHAPELTAYLDESVLSRPYGGPVVLREQVRHLLNLCDTRENVHIRVFRHEAYEHAGPMTPSMTLLTFPKDQQPREALYVEAPNTTATWVHDEDKVEIHRASLLSVAQYALDK